MVKMPTVRFGQVSQSFVSSVLQQTSQCDAVVYGSDAIYIFAMLSEARVSIGIPWLRHADCDHTEC